jgi:hypothetical protein
MPNSALLSFENSFAIASNQIMVGIISFLPSLLGAVVLLLLGLIVAGWLKSLTVKILDLTKLGNLFTNPAIKEFLKNAQISQKIEIVIGEIVRWLVITLFFMASVNILGLTSVSLFLNNIISGIPTLVAAVIILVVGVVVASFLEKMAKGSLGSSDPSMGRLVGKGVSYGTMTFFVLAALSQLGIASFFIEIVFAGFVAALALALGIGLGLGSKDLIKKLLEDWYKKLQH